MQFTDLTFLIVFLPVLLPVYYLVRPAYRQMVLLFMSLLFYACGSSEFLLLLSFSVFVNIALAKEIRRVRTRGGGGLAKIFLVMGLTWNLGILAWFKYSNFSIDIWNKLFHQSVANIPMLAPLGISFFTFKAVSLLADVYRGAVPQCKVLDMAAYLTFFGQIQSGPISRYGDFNGERDYSLDMISGGVVRFMVGFSKKIMLADVLSKITAEIFDATAVYSTGLVWLGSICYSLQLYYDFSGYSDMAIGLGNMLGIHCKENFVYPYATKTVAGFWRRWHISLGEWFRDYVYIPMGGSREGNRRLFINLAVVWFLTGLWHGAGWNYIVWGLGYFVVISLEKAFRLPDRIPGTVWRTVYRIGVLLFINFQWVLFRASGLRAGLGIIKKMIIYTPGQIPSGRAVFLLKDYGVFIAVAIIFALPFGNSWIKEKCEKNLRRKAVYDLITGICVVAVFVVALSFVISGQNNPFLYGNF